MVVKREIKVGIFVLVGLIVAGIIIFLVGDERRVFDKHFSLHAAFEDVQGLKPGAPVRMGGVDVGTVKSVEFGHDAKDKRIHIYFTVVAAAHERIRTDSTVTIANKGLLGDKMLEVIQGSEGKGVLPDGGDIPSLPPQDFGRFATKADEVFDLTKKVLTNIETVTKTAADPKVNEDLKATLASFRILMSDAAAHDGFVHRLLTDPKMADHLDQVFVDGARAGRSFDKVATDVRVLLRQAKEGPGLAHTLLYSKDSDQMVKSLAKVSEELALTMQEIRTGKGAAHELVYGESGGNVTKNLEQITSDLKVIVADVKAGKGTVGALLVDPSIYEDLKSILGNVDRNQVLRAIVRYTIKQDESKPSVPMAPVPKPAASGVTDPPKAVPPAQKLP